MGCINDAHCGAGAAARLIRVAGPSITESEVAWVAQAVRDGWHENYQKYVRLFEERFARHTGRKYAVATSSGSGALHLAYLALGLKEGDEVLVKVLDIDRQGKIRLSRKEALTESGQSSKH